MSAAFQAGWYRFFNGEIWRVSADCTAQGIVFVPDYEDASDLEQRLDAIAEAVTGSVAGLEDFSYNALGAGWVAFSGDVTSCFDEDDLDDVPTLVDPSSSEWMQHMQGLYDLTDVEVAHAVQALNLAGQAADATDATDAEYVIPMAGTPRAVHYPRGQQVATYVRVVVGGCLEVGRLTAQTVLEQPMAAVTGLLGHLTRFR